MRRTIYRARRPCGALFVDVLDSTVGLVDEFHQKLPDSIHRDIPHLGIAIEEQGLGHIAADHAWDLSLQSVIIIAGPMAAAIKHNFISRDDVLTRMPPRRDGY